MRLKEFLVDKQKQCFQWFKNGLDNDVGKL